MRDEPVPYEIRSLESIANKINNTQEKIATRTNEIFKQKFAARVSEATEYNSLNDKELFRVIKSKTYNEQLLEETFQQRIKNKTLKERSTVAGLFLTNSKSIQTAIAAVIPDDEIVYTLNLAHSLLESVKLEFLELENTQEQKKIELHLVVEDIQIKAVGIGISKKAAKLEAAKLCLAKWVEGEIALPQPEAS